MISYKLDRLEREFDILTDVIRNYWIRPLGKRKRKFWAYYQWMRGMLLP